MSAGQLLAEVAKRNNRIKVLVETIDAKDSLIEALKSDYQKLKEDSERLIKIAVDDFVECDRKRIELKKKCEKLASELFHKKNECATANQDWVTQYNRANSYADELGDLKQRKLVKIAIWLMKRGQKHEKNS
jgi:hypothetical protein